MKHYDEIDLNEEEEAALDRAWASLSVGDLEKHCGVCEEDDAYFGSPISREVTILFPNEHHANGVEIVAMTPAGMEPKPALWKPEGSENSGLQSWIGGPQYLREEAAYLVDRSLGFFLVPVAYVTAAYDEQGACVYYTHGIQPARDPDTYAAEWIEKAGTLDYVLSQIDRSYKHNYGTHPEDAGRMILFDNGLCLPQDGREKCYSPFYDLVKGKQLSQGVKDALRRTLADASMWLDVTSLVGFPAVETCKRVMNECLSDYTSQEAQ